MKSLRGWQGVQQCAECDLETDMTPIQKLFRYNQQSLHKTTSIIIIYFTSLALEGIHRTTYQQALITLTIFVFFKFPRFGDLECAFDRDAHYLKRNQDRASKDRTEGDSLVHPTLTKEDSSDKGNLLLSLAAQTAFFFLHLILYS